MKKVIMLLLLVLIVVAGITAYAPRTQLITMATGGTGGPYNIIGSAMAELITANVRGIRASARVTAGSVVNVGQLQAGEAVLALAMNDVVYYAHSGTKMFEGSVHGNLAGVAALYPDFVHIFVRADSPIYSIADLRGRRVGVGTAGSGTEVNARQILFSYGLTYDDLRADFISFAESAAGLRNGTVDAAFLTSELPNAALKELATTMDIRFIPIEAAKFDEIVRHYPFYFSIEIPANTYRGQTEPLATAAVTSLLIVRKDLPEELVYNMTKAIFTNLEILSRSHPSAGMIRLNPLRAGMSIPLHPGAERYFMEIGN